MTSGEQRHTETVAILTALRKAIFIFIKHIHKYRLSADIFFLVDKGFKLAFNYLKAKRFVDAIDVCHKVKVKMAGALVDVIRWDGGTTCPLPYDDIHHMYMVLNMMDIVILTSTLQVFIFLLNCASHVRFYFMQLINLRLYTFCRSLPENIPSLTPTSNSFMQKYIPQEKYLAKLNFYHPYCVVEWC